MGNHGVSNHPNKREQEQPSWRSRLRSILPTADIVRSNKYVKWIGPSIYHPRLWHLNRHGVALGLAIGLFFGFLIPLFQIPVTALVAVWLRGNLLVAVVSTLVSNPLTYAPIYFFAYRLGALILGDMPVDGAQFAIDEDPKSIIVSDLDSLAGKFVSFGKPLIFGLATLAISSSAVGYVIVLMVWRIAVLTQWRRRENKS